MSVRVHQPFTVIISSLSKIENYIFEVFDIDVDKLFKFPIGRGELH
jgi:hypothetical protein